ncbi:MAG TPA: NINE protein [Coleofasciculaceae cyanobacterium]
MLGKPKDRRIAAILALTGLVLPISGLHKFYLGQPRWGIVYLLLSWTLIPKVASAIEGAWYLFQDSDQFAMAYGVPSLTTTATDSGNPLPHQVVKVADAVRQLEQLRQDGLISEYEFEQKRRQLLDQLG